MLRHGVSKRHTASRQEADPSIEDKSKSRCGLARRTLEGFLLPGPKIPHNFLTNRPPRQARPPLRAMQAATPKSLEGLWFWRWAGWGRRRSSPYKTRQPTAFAPENSRNCPAERMDS